MAGAFNLRINQGETFYQSFQWLNGDGVTPVNLTGYTGRCQIRNGAYNQGVIKSVPVVILNTAQGRFALSLAAVETAAIPTTGYDHNKLDKYPYDIEFTSANGTVYRVLQGYAEISPEVTK